MDTKVIADRVAGAVLARRRKADMLLRYYNDTTKQLWELRWAMDLGSTFPTSDFIPALKDFQRAIGQDLDKIHQVIGFVRHSLATEMVESNKGRVFIVYTCTMNPYEVRNPKEVLEKMGFQP